MNTPPTRLKYWLIAGQFDDDRIVVEWSTSTGPERSEGIRCESFGSYSMHWLYGAPPDELEDLAEQALLDRNEYGVEGVELVGYLSRNEVDEFVCALMAEAAA